MIHKACMPVYMNSGKIVADGWTGGRGFEGSTRGPRGPKKTTGLSLKMFTECKATHLLTFFV